MQKTQVKPTTVHDIRTFQISDLTVSRDTSSGGRQISGYAVMFNQPSKPLPFIEYISSDAFKNVDMSEVQLLYAHDFDNILARVDSGTLSLKSDDKGLFFIAQIPDTTLGNDVYTNVSNGNLKGLSFSADIAPNGDDWDTQDDGTVIHTINQFAHLYEISLTSIPAYTETSVQVSRDYKEVLRDMNNTDNPQSQAQPANDKPDKVAVLNALAELLGVDNSSNSDTAQQDDFDAAADGDTERADNPNKDSAEPASDSNSAPAASSAVPTEKSASASTAAPASSSASSASSAPVPAASGSNSAALAASDGADDSDKKEKQPVRSNQIVEKKVKKMDITPNNQANKKETIVRDFANFLKTGEVADTIRRDDANNIGLSNGSVIIPETILTPEHEQYQFPRLGSLVRTVKVSTTTGKLPVFQTSDDKLSIHTEFQPSERHAAPEIKPINWDLKTYTGNYAFSQDLISDSSYNWQSELQSRLQELKDNTNDNLIINQLTNGVNVVRSTDLISDIKTALNVNLKPQDSAAASIILSQAAFNALDQLNDKMGRPLVQPNVTQPMGKTILGKTVVVVDDTLFPSAKAGDANVVVAPLQKAVINFQENEITGQFIDSYDIWYRILGIYLREDVVQARKDLITLITTTAATQNAASTGSDSSSTTTGK